MSALCSPTRLRILVVGIGSPHGDDQAGWRVIEQLERKNLPYVELRKASVPHDVVDWVDCQQTLHVIDACEANANASETSAHRRFEMIEEASGTEPNRYFRESSPHSSSTSIARPIGLRSAGSHQIDALTVLELVACLNRLPKKVFVWTIPGQLFAPCESPTARCEAAIASCVEQLSTELLRAGESSNAVFSKL